jgi:hypothetical protein
VDPLFAALARWPGCGSAGELWPAAPAAVDQLSHAANIG